MIITKLSGGLGNQMFQYAVGRAAAWRAGAELLIDNSIYADPAPYPSREYALSQFSLDERVAAKADVRALVGGGLLERVLPRRWSGPRGRRVVEADFTFDPEILSCGAGVYLEGYWQSERYFLEFTDEIRQRFTLIDELSVSELPLARQMREAPSVSLHVRRGDYVAVASTNELYGTCSLQYYAEALRVVCERAGAPRVFAFSDDPEWVKGNLKTDLPLCVVSDGRLTEGQELVLMSLCQHHIVANSSFSWWGAWLDPSPDAIVVAPDRWFQAAPWDTRDLVPESWIRL
ncbi:MAG: alpha-1,2-fucosyltransferase [Myxococcales bacterium]|nr:alpha-1,2-fucosyltransferase [Myxococcales bacterium]